MCYRANNVRGLLSSPPRSAPAALQTTLAQVYAQARFRCSNPQCGQWVALDDQCLVYVDDKGNEIAENLLAMCPRCYRQRFSQASRAAWKSVQLAYDSPFDYDSFAFLAFLEAVGQPLQIDTERLIDIRHVVTTGGVKVAPSASGKEWTLELTVKGTLLLEAWRQGRPG